MTVLAAVNVFPQAPEEPVRPVIFCPSSSASPVNLMGLFLDRGRKPGEKAQGQVGNM